jgi:hypothetical protein
VAQRGVYNVPEEAKQAVAAASSVRDIPKGIRMKLYNAVDRAFNDRTREIPPSLVAKWGAAGADPSGVSRLKLLEAFVEDPTCATMVMQERMVREQESFANTAYVFMSKDDLEKEWQHLHGGGETPSPRFTAKVEELMSTAKSERQHPQTGEVLYEVLGRMERGTSGRDRSSVELSARGRVTDGAAARELRGFMQERPPADGGMKALTDKPKPKRKAAAKKAAKAEAKAKPFTHPGAKLEQAVRKKLAAATNLRADLEMAAAADSSDTHTRGVVDLLSALISRGDCVVARVTEEVRNARGAVNDETWPDVLAAAEAMVDEVDREVKFAKSRLSSLKKPTKAKAA